MISTYPDFTPLSLSLRKDIENITKSFAPYSDFNFTSLFAWNTDDSTEVSILNDNLIIKLPDYISGELVVSLLGDHMIDESIRTLLRGTRVIQLVPETVIKNIQNREVFEIIEDPDNADYIYRVSHVAKLPGQKYKKKRNKVNTFISATSERVTIERVTNVKPELAQQMLEVFEDWSTATKVHDTLRNLSNKDNAQERMALTRLVNNANAFDLHITVARNDEKILAFSINERLDDEYAICHFEKTRDFHPQISTFIASQAAKDLHDIGCVFVNWEQDLGLEGLRRSKLSYHPEYFLKKYSVTAKD